jgi:hypothetical protein
MYDISAAKFRSDIAVPAIIHVKLSGEGDFGPVDLECAIPPARLPVVMAALFGPSPSMARQSVGAVQGSVRADVEPHPTDGGRVVLSAHEQTSQAENNHVQMPEYGGLGMVEADEAGEYAVGPGFSGVLDPGMFITGFVGNFADLVGRLQPRGFAETILLAAIWLQYREGRSFVTRGDVRRLLRRQDHLRMPRNFSRDFHAAVARGYLEEVENEDGYAVARDGFQWFRMECTK